MQALNFSNSSNIMQKQRINIKHWRQLIKSRYNVEGLNWHYKIKLETGYHVPLQNAHFFKLQIRISDVFPSQILGAERERALVTPFIIDMKLALLGQNITSYLPWICICVDLLPSPIPAWYRNKKYWLLHYQCSFKQWPTECLWRTR